MLPAGFDGFSPLGGGRPAVQAVQAVQRGALARPDAAPFPGGDQWAVNANNGGHSSAVPEPDYTTAARAQLGHIDRSHMTVNHFVAELNEQISALERQPQSRQVQKQISRLVRKREQRLHATLHGQILPSSHLQLNIPDGELVASHDIKRLAARRNDMNALCEFRNVYGRYFAAKDLAVLNDRIGVVAGKIRTLEFDAARDYAKPSAANHDARVFIEDVSGTLGRQNGCRLSVAQLRTDLQRVRDLLPRPLSARNREECQYWLNDTLVRLQRSGVHVSNGLVAEEIPPALIQDAERGHHTASNSQLPQLLDELADPLPASASLGAMQRRLAVANQILRDHPQIDSSLRQLADNERNEMNTRIDDFTLAQALQESVRIQPQSAGGPSRPTGNPFA